MKVYTIIILGNAPNPFSVSTTISYLILSPTKDAFLKIYSIDGRLIKSMPIDPYSTEIRVSADDMQNGIYSYTIEEGGIISDKKKMVVIK